MDQQYRALSPDEIIQEGDELRERPNALTDWAVISKLGSVVGLTVKDASIIRPPLQFRRPIPAKSETVECAMCGKESHPLLTCEQFRGVSEVAERAASFVAKVPPVKESLTTNHDESSDNSLSFKEISELNQKCSKLFDKAYELQEELAATKLRVEKAEAARDGAKKLITKLQQDKSQAERERDEAIKTRQEVEQRLLHAETELAEIYMAFGYPDPSDSEDIGPSDVREVVVKERDALRANETRLREALEKIMEHMPSASLVHEVARKAISK